MRTLRVVTYHYVRPLRESEFPDLKGLELARFHAQVRRLAAGHEMVDVEGALRFLRGDDRPPRDGCLLTFDDGLRDHVEHVLPFLARLGVPAAFFLVTATQEEGAVVDVHKNHFLTARLGLARYRALFGEALAAEAPGETFEPDPAQARRTYAFDTPEAAVFKYLVNFVLPVALKARVMDRLFREHLGDEAAFSRRLYLQWDEARRLAAAGMHVGGHSHRHQALATLPEAVQAEDLGRCAGLLTARLGAHPARAFCYPYGKADSFTAATVVCLERLGFAAAFTTEPGENAPGADRYRIRRLDTNHVRD